METISEAPASTADQASASWMQAIPLNQRLFGLGWRLAVGFAIATWLAYSQQSNHEVKGAELLWSLAIVCLAITMALRKFRTREVRMYASSLVFYTRRQRTMRAGKWLVPAVFMLAFIWGVQFSSNQLAGYWWYAWPVLFPLLIGVGLYLLRSERVISAAGQYARAGRGRKSTPAPSSQLTFRQTA